MEHKVDLIAEYADEVIALKEGRIIRKGAAADVLSDLSLMEQGVQLPQVAVLCNELRKKGVSFSKVPVTKAQAAAEIRKLMKKETIQCQV